MSMRRLEFALRVEPPQAAKVVLGTRKLGTVDGLSEVALEFRQAAGKGSSPNQFVHGGRVARSMSEDCP